jgi:tetratricopeptide (TPR) repeat protein
MLAELHFLSGEFAEALHDYQASLASDPNRFNALLAAGQAAERLGERNVAAGYYRTLLANCTSANGNALVALRHPRKVVNEMTTQATSENAKAKTDR